MPELSPQDLDRVEDALLDLDAALDDPSLADPIRARLRDYQEVLTISREALPDEEPPAGVLASVMEAARAEAASPVAVGAGESAWTKFRRTYLVPSLALVGSAAVVLLMIGPDVGSVGKDEMVDEPNAAAGAPSAPPPLGAAVPAEEDAKRELAERADDFAVPERAGSAEGAPPAADEAEAAPAEDGDLLAQESEIVADKKRSKGGSGSSAPAKPRPKPAPEPAAKAPAPKQQDDSVTWTAIADADAKRRGRRCGLATLTYRSATKSSDHKLAARGHAGLGLCAEQGGEDGEIHLARARKLDRNIDSFIRDERARAYRPGGQSSKRKAKPKQNALDGL